MSDRRWLPVGTEERELGTSVEWEELQDENCRRYNGYS